MPTYEYACKDCGQHLEVVQKFTDASLTVCPNCEGSLRKVFSAPGIAFKGSGFYKNDSRGSAKPSGSSSESSTDASSSSDASSDPGSPKADTTSSDSKKSESGSKDKPAATKPLTPAAPTSSTKGD